MPEKELPMSNGINYSLYISYLFEFEMIVSLLSLLGIGSECTGVGSQLSTTGGGASTCSDGPILNVGPVL